MDNLLNLFQGFADLWSVDVLLWCVVGVVIGTIVGALPGLGPAAGIAVLLPLSFSLEPVSALILLMGIYQGAMYGGRLSSILINVPGEASAVVTTFDGYPMTRQGKAGYALSLSAVASFVGGMIGFVGLAFLMPVVAKAALLFGPPEFFALMVFALVATSGLAETSRLKGLISVGIGLMISLIGLDPISGTQRLTFGSVELWDGVSFVVVAVGVFGLSEVLCLLTREATDANINQDLRFLDLLPRPRQLAGNSGSMLRGSLVGFGVGVLPGAGATVATFLSYSLEKRVSGKPEKFGHGADQGLSGPEAANNSSIGGALVPLFTLGIPGSAITAVLLGALITVGLQPGPKMLTESGPVVWAAIAGLMLANVILLVLNTALVPLFTTLIRKAQPYLVPLISALCVIGVYLLNYRFFEVALMALFGVLGYLLRQHGFPLGALVLGVVLGPELEKGLRQSLLISQNDPTIFLTRPISVVLLGLTAVLLVLPVLVRRFRRVSTRTR